MIILPTLYYRARKGIGDMVPYIVHGRQIARRKPREYKDAHTPAQLLNRQRMTLISALARYILYHVPVAFPQRPKTETEQTAFLHANNPHAIAYDGDTPYVDFAKVALSGGTLIGARANNIRHVEKNIFLADIVMNLDQGNANATDFIHLIIMRTDELSATHITLTRTANVTIGFLTPSSDPAPYVMYAYAINDSGTQASNTHATPFTLTTIQ
jgi:hypothetical protein